MNERENLLEVLHQGNPQWMPNMLDCLQMMGPTIDILERPMPGCDVGEDWFGIKWKRVDNPDDPAGNGWTCIPGSEYVEDVTQWRELVKFPSLDDIDWSIAHEQRDGYDRESKLSMFFWESGPFERLVSLTGFENALIALLEEPEAFNELMAAITDYKCALVPLIKEHYAPDMICVLEPVAIMGGFAHSNDQVEMERLYGNRVAFIGPVNTEIMCGSNHTDEEAIAEARRMIDVFAPYKNLVFDTTPTFPERAAKCIAEYREYARGIYG